MKEMDRLTGLPPFDQMLKILYTNMPLGVVLQDTQGKILAANPAAAGIFGAPVDAMLGQNAFDPRLDAIHEDGSPFPVESFPSAVALATGNQVEGVVVGARSPVDSRRIWVLVSAIPQVAPGEEKPYCVFSTYIDVTEMIEARKSEKLFRRHFKSLFDNMSEGVAFHEIIYDDKKKYIDYRLVDVNSRYEEILSLRRDDVVGRLGSEVYGTNPAPYLDEFCRVGETGIPYSFETYFPPLKIHFFISVAPLERGKFATIFIDISERKRSEEEKGRYRSELQERNQVLDSIVHSASRDLRSPLINIQGFGLRLDKQRGEMAQILSSGELPPERLEALKEIAGEAMGRSIEYIESSVKKMDSILDGILRLSKAGRFVLRFEDIDMNNLMEDLVSAMSGQAEREKALILVEDLPPCYGDADQIRQAFMSIIDNALKYRDPARPLVLKIRGLRTDSWSEYLVEDSGLGVDDSYKEKIWELFFRMPAEDSVPGEGLGLTLVRRIVDKHHGEVWMESKLGKGSVMHVRLPSSTPGSFGGGP